MLFYFGRVKGNFPKEVTLEQDLKGREEGSSRQKRGQCIPDRGTTVVGWGGGAKAASLSNGE